MVREFNIDNLISADSFIMSIVGGQNTGKSTLLYYLLSKISSMYRYIYFFTNNPKYLETTELNNYIWKGNIKIVGDNIGDILESVGKWSVKERKRGINFKSLVIFDDVAKLIRSKIYKNLTYGRHANISYILLLHDMLSIQPEERSQITHKVFSTPIHDIKRALDITDNVKVSQLKIPISEIHTDLGENENYKIRKYVIVTTENLTVNYMVVPDDILKKIKGNEISIIDQNDSMYKNIIKGELEKILPKLLD